MIERKTRMAWGVWAAACWILAAPRAVPATDDIRDEMWLRIEDARGVPGGSVAIVLQTEHARAIGSGRLEFGLPAPAPSVLAACGSTTFLTAGVVVSNESFDVSNQVFSVDFVATGDPVNISHGPLAAVFCTIAADAEVDQRPELQLAVGPGETALADPLGVPLLFEPRGGELRIEDALDRSLDLEDADAKPGAGAVLEVETEMAFAIGGGTVALQLDPAWAAGAPTVVTRPGHGVVAITATSWDGATSRFTFSFESADGSLNASIPGALFSITVPTVADDLLVGQIVPLEFAAGQTAIVGPSANALAVQLEAGELLFSTDPKVEDVFRDGFTGGSMWGWGNNSQTP